MSALGGIAFAALHATLTLADRSEARVRNNPFPDQPSILYDVDTSPSARLDVESHTVNTYLIYAPRFTLRSVSFESSTEVLHRGTIATTMKPSRRSTVLLSEETAYGIENFSALLLPQPSVAGQPPPVDRLPVSQSVHIALSHGTLLFSTVPARRWRLTTLAEYVVSGGVERVDQAIFPLERGVRGSVEVERVLTRTDGEITTVRAARFAFDTGGTLPNAKNTIVDLVESWRHRWTRFDETTIGAGVSGVFVQLPTSSFDLYPLVEGTYVHREPDRRLEVRGVARLITYIDRLRGTADYQAQSTLGFLYAPWNTRHGLAVRLQFGFAQSVPVTKHDGIRVLMGEVGVLYRANEHILFESGVRGMAQSVRDEPDVPFAWAGFFAATFTTQPFRL